MTFRNSDFGDNTDPQSGSGASSVDKSDLSASMWSRQSGCSKSQDESGSLNDLVYRFSPNQTPKSLQEGGTLSDLVYRVPPDQTSKFGDENYGDLVYRIPRPGHHGGHHGGCFPPGDMSEGRGELITVSNGDQLTVGTGGPHNFKVVDKDGQPVRVVDTIDSMADDAPTKYVLSNGAIYMSRGGWNHNESITWPDGDVVNFTDSGKITSYQRGKIPDLVFDPTILGPIDINTNIADIFKLDQVGTSTDLPSKDSYVFDNGDRFVSMQNGWELITAHGEKVTRGTPDPNSPMDATRIPLSNGATLISGGWGTDTITYPDGESISFSKNGQFKSQLTDQYYT